MLTASGVNFQQSGPSRWRAVLPEGPYLPCPVVVQRDEHGLLAHIEDTAHVYSCQEDSDGRIRIDLNSPTQAGATFDPQSLEYGVDLGSRTESYAANGDWHFAFENLRVVETPDGQATARCGRHTLQATTWSDRITIGPKPFLLRLREHGLAAALRGTPCYSSFLFRDNGWKNRLFPELLSARQEQAHKQEQRRQAEEVRQLAHPQTGKSIELTESSVRVGGVRLARRP